MDPITVIASFIAIVQALDRIAVLTSKSKLFLEAPSEVRSLMGETLDLRRVLDRVRLNAVSWADEDGAVLGHLLNSCESIVGKIESLIRNKLIKERPTGFAVQRLAWARRKREVLSLRRQLQETKGMLCLSLVGTSISKQTQIQAGVAELKDLVVNSAQLDREFRARCEAATEDVKGSSTWCLEDSSTKGTCGHGPICHDSDIVPQRYNPWGLCSRTCNCRCHHRVLIRLGLLSLHHLTGSIIIGAIGNVLHPNRSACSNSRCLQRSAPRLLVVFHPPKWLLAYAFGLVYRGGPSPSLALYFPRIVPPDSDIAIAIRSGNCSRIRKLISEGEASPLDVIGPYGLTALNLAISYGQSEAADIFVSIGAHRYATTVPGRIGDIHQFWTNFSPIRCSLPASEVIKDLFHLTSTENYIDMIHSFGPTFLEEGDPLPRLHKSILGLTLQNNDELIRKSRSSINDIDSLGRTALHWAVCKNNLSALDHLLRCGSDPNVHDIDGRTPIHLAVAIGQSRIVETLINAGADLLAEDTLLYTPMHVAAMNGHSSIALQLLQAGGDIERPNIAGETPLMSACLADKHHTAKLLLSCGASPEKLCHWGCSAFGRAVKVNAHRTVQMLIEYGVPTNMLRHDKKTLFHMVALAGDNRMIQLLLEVGVKVHDVDARDEDGMTALQILQLRKNAENLMDNFLRLLEQGMVRMEEGEEEEGTFFDAVEVQED